MKRSSMLGSARRLGARLLGELRESTEPFVMRQSAFAGKTTVGECVQAVLALPPCNAEDQGERFTLGTGVPPAPAAKALRACRCARVCSQAGNCIASFCCRAIRPTCCIRA